MKYINDNVALLVENETRADLYTLWLDDYDVRTALTKRQADEVFSEQNAVAVMDGNFGGEDTPKLLDVLRDRNPVCEFIATQERSEVFPTLNVDNRIVKPVFQDELVELVERLLLRTNYRVAIQEYYRLNLGLASFEVGEAEEKMGKEEYRTLEERARALHSLLSEYKAELSTDDVTAIMRSLSENVDFDTTGDSEKLDSKYRPTQCSHCSRSWGDTKQSDPTMGFERLGAYVWRCTECGHVQMHADPSHQQVGSYRR